VRGVRAEFSSRGKNACVYFVLHLRAIAQALVRALAKQ